MSYIIFLSILHYSIFKNMGIINRKNEPQNSNLQCLTIKKFIMETNANAGVEVSATVRKNMFLRSVKTEVEH